MQFLGLDVSFLKSTRFWKVVIIALLEGLIAVGVVDGDTAEILTRLVEMILGASVAIRTVDRFAEKSGSTDTQ